MDDYPYTDSPEPDVPDLPATRSEVDRRVEAS